MKRILYALLFTLLPAVASAQVDWGVHADGGWLYFLTNTVGTDGVAETLAGETIAVYVDNSDTQLTTGASIDDDVDLTTGLHRITIDTTQSGFDAGARYTVVYTAGTCDSVSIVGRVIGTFRLGAVPANVTQNAGTAITANAGRQEVNVSHFGGTSGTFAGGRPTVSIVDGGITFDTFEAGAITADAVADGAIDANTFAANSITATAIADDAITAAKIAADAITAAEIAADAIAASELAADSIGTSEFAAEADINAQVLDVLNVDTFAEPVQGTPAATTTLAVKINYIYKFLRNRTTQSATVLSIYNDDATTVDHKATVSDSGTVFGRTEIESGP